MLGDAISFPIEGDSGIKRLLIGGLLVFPGSLVIVPTFWVLGFAARCGLAGVREEPEPPSLTDDIGGLIVDGLKVFAVSLGYLLIPLVVMFAAAATIGIGAIQGGDAAAGAGIVGIVLALVGVVLFLIGFYVFPAGVLRFMDEESLGAAFSIGAVTDVAFDSDYFVAWLIAFGVNIVIGIINQILIAILIGIILFPFLSFYQQVVVFYLYGRGYRKSVGAERMGGGDSGAGTDPLSGTGGEF